MSESTRPAPKRVKYRLPVSGDRHIPWMRAQAQDARELRGSLWETIAKGAAK